MSVGLEMKLQFAVVAMLLASLLAVATVDIAEAQWDALGSGFAVTTDWHGKDVPIGMSITATAGWAPSLAPPVLRDVVVQTVKFIWHEPYGTVVWDDTFPILGPIVTPALPPDPIPQELIDWATDPNNAGISYWYAQDTRNPGEFGEAALGDWGVQAIFHNAVEICGKNSDPIRIRATSFNAVPEVPFGTIAILLSWIGIFGVFVLRKKHIPA